MLYDGVQLTFEPLEYQRMNVFLEVLRNIYVLALGDLYRQRVAVAVKLIIPTILFTLIFSFIGYFTVKQAVVYHNYELDFDEATATATKVESYEKNLSSEEKPDYKTYYMVDYEYTYNDTSYSGFIDTPEVHNVGEEFKILVNPEDPAENTTVLDEEDSASLYIVPFVVFICWVIVIGIIVYSFFANKDKKN